jgi:hypothetical protein
MKNQFLIDFVDYKKKSCAKRKNGIREIGSLCSKISENVSKIDLNAKSIQIHV